MIGNAVKYVAPGTRPHVLIGSELVGDMVEIRVIDNGIGIPAQRPRPGLRQLLPRVEPGSYPGTGLGLAICARAVERHGGRISAREGLDGGGTTMIFTLPADLGQSPTSRPSSRTQRGVAPRAPSHRRVVRLGDRGQLTARPNSIAVAAPISAALVPGSPAGDEGVAVGHQRGAVPVDERLLRGHVAPCCAARRAAPRSPAGCSSRGRAG